MTPPPSFSELFTIALTKSLNNGYQDYYYLSEISEILGQYKLIEIKKGKPPKFSKKTYHALSALNEIFSQWMQYLNLVTYSKDNNRIINEELINSLISNGVTFKNIKKLPNYNNFINFFSFHYALNQYNHLENSFNDGEYIELEQNLNDVLYGECGDPILNNFLSEIRSRFTFNLNHYDRFSYIPNLTKENVSILNKIDILTEIFKLTELVKDDKPRTILEELDHDFQLNQQDVPYHLNSVKFNDSSISDGLIIPTSMVGTLEDRILSTLKSLTATQFEHFSIDFIKRLIGKENIKSIHNGKVGDGGIDGIVKIKKHLGNNYEEYYIQCKRYDKTSISESELRDFVGAMVRHRNSKNGVFITTSHFSKSCMEYINDLYDYDMILIDGQDLVNRMLESNMGIKEIIQNPIFEIDEDFFNQFPKK